MAIRCFPTVGRSEVRVRCRTTSRTLANVSHLMLVTGGRYEVHLQAHRVDTPYCTTRFVRGLGTKDLRAHRSASGQGPGSGTLAGARLCLATRLLPMETWHLPLDTGHLG